MVHLRSRRVRDIDEGDRVEREQFDKVNSFITHLTWAREEKDKGWGITWLELYILYGIHGGGVKM